MERTRVNIIFDLDGTLIDSAPDLRRAANRMLAAEGRAPLDLAETTRFIGNGFPKLVERVMRARDLPEASYPRLLEMMRAAYEAEPAVETRPYPGVPESLAALTGAGHRLAVCTNKPEAPARHILDLLGLGHFFGEVVGGDTLPEKKPDPAPVRRALAALGAGPALYVGDSEVDAGAARATGLPFVLFTPGYRKVPVEELAPDRSFDHYAELPAIVAGF